MLEQQLFNFARNFPKESSPEQKTELTEFFKNPEIRSIINKMDAKGHTALHIACATKNLAMVKLLLDNGADPNQGQAIEKYLANINIKKTALHVAALFGYDDIMRLLLEKGANPNIQNGSLETPFMVMINRVNPDFSMIKLFIQYGADINIKNKDGVKAFDKTMMVVGSKVRLEFLQELYKLKTTDGKLEAALKKYDQEADLNNKFISREEGVDPRVEYFTDQIMEQIAEQYQGKS